MVNIINVDKPMEPEDSSLPLETNDFYLAPVAGSDMSVELVTQEAYIEPQNLQQRLASPRFPNKKIA
jgi:hypothetical protein